jgi:hypothetical protein
VVTGSITFRGGRLPNDPAKPRLKLSHFLTGGAYTPPPAANWDQKVSNWGILGNADWGNCALAAQSHSLQTWTANAGTEIVPLELDTLRAYSEVTGFNPNAGPPGRNPTDQGTVMQEALGYWRRVGMPVTSADSVARHKILAFAEVDHRSPTELEAAVALFGEVLLGISFPAAAMQAFEAGEPWDVWEDDGGIEGGHAVCSARYDGPTKRWWVVTWGREQEVTQAFLDRYLDEAWTVIAPEWIAANGTTPSGLDLAGLAAAFTEITGEPAVWGDTPPEPRPHSGGLDIAVRALASSGDVRSWLADPHAGKTRRVAALVRAVVEAAA